MTQLSSEQLEKLIQEEHKHIQSFFMAMGRVIVGQNLLLERILLGLLANGHILIEGVPGLAKTMTVKTFAQLFHANFQRIQFTPDMLPADLTGALIYDQQTGQFRIKKGPVFTNILLADEINRAPAKVQSALLEVMQEKQVTIGEQTYVLERPFLVLATQNPIEQDGTYFLPESQLDRFMLNVKITYPSREEERDILRRMSYTDRPVEIQSIFDVGHIQRMRELVDQVYMDEKVEGYLLDVVRATRDPVQFRITDIAELMQYGVSPRATIHLSLAAKAYAFIQGRTYVRPEDIKAIAGDVMRHRVILSYQATTQGVAADDLIQKILDCVPMP